LLNPGASRKLSIRISDLEEEIPSPHTPSFRPQAAQDVTKIAPGDPLVRPSKVN
jgi:hypothetical protein